MTKGLQALALQLYSYRRRPAKRPTAFWGSPLNAPSKLSSHSLELPAALSLGDISAPDRPFTFFLSESSFMNCCENICLLHLSEQQWPHTAKTDQGVSHKPFQESRVVGNYASQPFLTQHLLIRQYPTDNKRAAQHTEHKPNSTPQPPEDPRDETGSLLEALRGIHTGGVRGELMSTRKVRQPFLGKRSFRKWFKPDAKHASEKNSTALFIAAGLEM